jgi:hypothetical protein
MLATFAPRQDVLPESQRLFWFELDGLQAQLPFLRDLGAADTEVWVQRKRDDMDRGGPIKISFFGGLDTLHRVRLPAWRPAHVYG